MPEPVRPVPPPPQEVAEARAHYERLLRVGAIPHDDQPLLQALLAATAPVEPNGNLVERVATMIREMRFAVGTPEDIARAILSHLAALGMGEARVALPSRADLATSIYERWSNAEESSGPWSDAERAADVTLDVIAARLAPILAAMAERVRAGDALKAAIEAEISYHENASSGHGETANEAFENDDCEGGEQYEVLSGAHAEAAERLRALIRSRIADEGGSP